MREILALVEFSGEKILRASQEAVSEAVRQAAKLDGRCTALVPGHRIPRAVPDGLKAFGVDRVLVCDDEAFSEYSTERYAVFLESVLKERAPDLLLMGGTAVARDLAPRVSERLGCGLVTEATFLNLQGGRLEATRAAYRPHASMILSFPGKGPAVVTLASGSAEVERGRAGDRCAFESAGTARVPLSLRGDRVTVERSVREIPSRVDLEDAEVIVAGGKGMQDGRNFRLLEELAELLGGTVAASRMAVDLKWRPRESMVGVTGKTVAPGLYIACGISGAIQHLMGMQSSDTIVAVNTDPNAPIFRVATLGILGDACEVLPVMIETLREAAAAASRREGTA